MLVGDAAGYVDALTGEGLGIALGGAEILANAVMADDPADYTRQWRRMSRRYRLLTSALLTASNSPARTMIVPAAATLPRVFNQAVKLLAQ
jgi:flavin-dependent dehydrogenase